MSKRLRDLMEEHPLVLDARRDPRCAKALEGALAYFLEKDPQGLRIWGRGPHPARTWTKVEEAYRDCLNLMAAEA